MSWIVISLGAFLVGFFTFRHLRGLQAVGHVPGYRPLFSPISLFGAALPPSFFNMGQLWSWHQRETAFFNHTHDLISIVPKLVGMPAYYVSSWNVMKQILGSENKFNHSRPRELSIASIVGDNIISANGEQWRFHRRVVAPAFGGRIHSHVREESLSVYRETFEDEGWTNKDEVFVPVINELILKMSIKVISRCGFGITSNQQVKGDMPFNEAVGVLADTIIPRLILPKLAYKLPNDTVRRIDLAWKTVFDGCATLISNQRNEAPTAIDEDDAKGGLLRRLIQFSSEGSRKQIMSDEEVRADIVGILIAGHETTAAGLSAALGFLALYPEEQEKAYQEAVQSVDSGISIDNLAPFKHIHSCFLEALRLYPPPIFLARQLTTDAPVKVEHPSEDLVVLKNGTWVIFDLISINRNPHHFPNPHAFLPSRWYTIPDSEIPVFSTGPRSCVGKKFATIEAVCLLVCILRDWRVEVKLDEGETKEMWETRVMGFAHQAGTVLSVGPVPLVLKRR